jgi:hypothetical protein
MHANQCPELEFRQRECEFLGFATHIDSPIFILMVDEGLRTWRRQQRTDPRFIAT